MAPRNPFAKLFCANRRAKMNEDVMEEDPDSNEGDENKVRGNWGRQIEFFLSCVSYAVGPGNIWRFPYVCMRNGGGAFLIPYFTCMLLCGMPMFYLEVALGQFSSLSVISVWKIAPVCEGVGVASIILTGIVTLYFNITLSWIIYYLIHSFTSTLPWGNCDNAWNTDLCLVRKSLSSGVANGSLSQTTLYNHTEVSSPESVVNVSDAFFSGNTTFVNETVKHSTPAEEFWHYNVLEISSGIDDIQGFQWKMFGAVLGSWIIVFLCLFKGVKSSGKVVYVTATLPYIFLCILLIRGLTLPGSIDGIMYFITPDWGRLLEFKVWTEACLQIFFSTGPGWGSLITLASYNRYHNRVHIDAMLVPLINCGTSFFAGLVIFSILGFMAQDAGLAVQDVVTSGPGLAFIAYPEALNKLPLPPLWAIMFFVMMLNIGLGTQFAMVETISSGFIDKYPGTMRVFKKKWAFTGFISIVMFILSFPFITKAGIYFFQLCDWYVAAVTLLVVAQLECIVVGIIYGIKRFSYDIECMIGRKPSLFMQALWTVVTPLLVTVIIVVGLKGFPTPSYGDYTYPGWAIGLGWVIAFCSMIPIIVYAIMAFAKSDGPILMRLRTISKPTADWGPALEKHRADYKYSIAQPVQMDEKEMECLNEHVNT